LLAIVEKRKVFCGAAHCPESGRKEEGGGREGAQKYNSCLNNSNKFKNDDGLSR
jgi:hypothetical protein